MKREVILKGSRDLYTSSERDPGTSPYPGSNTPGMNLYQIWNNIAGGVNGQYAYVWPNDGVEGTHRIGFEKGPTLARFTKVTIRTGWDRSARNGWDPWGFPGKENASNAYGPRMAITLQKRSQSPADWIVGTGAAYYEMTADDGHYVSINQSDGFLLHELSWEMTSHPEGGPWALEDINNLGVGIQCWWSYITEGEAAGHAFETVGNAFHKLRIPYLSVTLEVEDLGGYVANIRHTTSLALRMMRRARNLLAPKAFIHELPTGIGSRVYMSHPKGHSVVEGEGWGRRRLERRSGLNMKRTYSPESFQAEDEAFDLRPYACLGWAAYRIDTPWNPELQGVALVDKGLGFAHERAQDAWSPRPGDSVLHRVIEGYPNVSFHGRAAQDGGDSAVCLYNYSLFATGWSTVSTAGDFSATNDPTVTMVEEQGFLGSCKLDYGAGGGKGGREQSLGALGAGRLHVRVIVKNTSIQNSATQFGEWYLRRGTDYWNDATRAWDGTPVYNAIPSGVAYGAVVADSIPATATTYHIGVGRFSSNMGPVILHGALVDVQFSDTTVAGARTTLVTLAAPIVRVADEHQMSQASDAVDRELWSYDRGTAVVEAQPFWRSVDLPADAVKPLIYVEHATNTWDTLQFVPKTGTTDLVRFERAISGSATFQLDCPLKDANAADIDLTRAHVLRVWARWLGAEGWSQYGPYSVEVGYGVFLEATGVLVGQGSIIGRLSVLTAISARNFIRIGCDATRFFDGYIRMWETRRSPLHGVECTWRL